MNSIYILLLLGIGLIFTSCQTYQANVLEPQNLLKTVEQERLNIPEYCQSDSLFTFVKCARWASDSSPELTVLKAEYEIFKSVSDLKTPYPNPSVSAGPTVNIGADALQKVSGAAALGFTIPLGPRLARQDDLNLALTTQAYEKVVISHRNLYLNLREKYMACALNHQKLILVKSAIEALKGQKESLVKAFNAGTISALEVFQISKILSKESLLEIQTEQAYQQSINELALMLGTRAENLKKFHFDIQLPAPGILPKKEYFSEILLKNNTTLASLKSEYLVADLQYKLELAKQIPDLTIGVDYAMDYDRISSLSPSIGTDLPIFDRNQQAIAQTQKTRDLALLNYKKSLNEAIHVANNNLTQYQNVFEQNQRYKEELLPHTQGATELSLLMYKTGNITSLMLFYQESELRTIRIEALDVQMQLFTQIIELEKSLGIPLFNIDQENFNLFNAQE